MVADLLCCVHTLWMPSSQSRIGCFPRKLAHLASRGHVIAFVLSLCLNYGWMPAVSAQSTPLPESGEPARKGIDLAGVEAIAAPGAPGPIAGFGREAFPVVTARDGQAVVAAAEWGKGRVVVLGHGGMLTADAHDHRELLARLIAWAAPDAGGVRAANLPRSMALALESVGTEWQAAEGDWRGALGDANLLGLDKHQRKTEADRALVRSFVNDGVGWITSGLAWGWLQLNPGRTLQEQPGNLILPEMGLAFADGIVREDAGDRSVIDGPPSPWAHAGRATDALAMEAVPRDERAAAGASITSALRTLGEGDHTLVRKRDALLAEQANLDERFATMHEDGLTWEDDALARLAIERFMIDAQAGFDAPVDAVVKHPSADGFPGAVPDDADRSSVTTMVITSIPGWRCTGLYAPPGEVVKLTFDNLPAGSSVQIGAHLDPESRGELNRLPRVVRRFEITEDTIEIANPVGGLIYLDIPKRELDGVSRSIATSVSAEGAVRSPHFVLGITTPESWETLRDAPGPWAELETDEIALTVPSAVVRMLDDPEALMEFWDEIAHTMNRLEPRRLNGLGDRQARFVPDISVSWGYMYAPAHRPLTVPTHSAQILVDLNVLRSLEVCYVWGFFHELGHWHQNSMWTFGGTGEVTVNIFTLYALDKVCGLPPAEARGFTPEKLLSDMRAHHEAGAPFDVWKRKPFLALAMYVQLQQAFGWELYEEVFAESRALPEAERPETDDEKRDQWLVRVSREAGVNFSRFFETWGVPTSDAARASLNDLPGWMPEGWK